MKASYNLETKKIETLWKNENIIPKGLQVIDFPEQYIENLSNPLYSYYYKDNKIEEVINIDGVLQSLRERRERECFAVINRNFIANGESLSWFDTLTYEQKNAANEWVQQWRDVTTKYKVGVDIEEIIPVKPSWL